MNANKQDAGGLPELPEPVRMGLNDVIPFSGYYTADQMRAYGEQCRATREGDGEVWADEAMKLADFFEGVRVFVTSRERIKHPEGTDLFDEHVTRLLRLAGSLRTLSRGVPEGRAVDDGLPEVLMPHADEWYRLCERRFYADRISISGELAEAIVHAVCNTTPPEVGGGRERDGDA